MSTRSGLLLLLAGVIFGFLLGGAAEQFTYDRKVQRTCDGDSALYQDRHHNLAIAEYSRVCAEINPNPEPSYPGDSQTRATHIENQEN